MSTSNTTQANDTFILEPYYSSTIKLGLKSHESLVDLNYAKSRIWDKVTSLSYFQAPDKITFEIQLV